MTQAKAKKFKAIALREVYEYLVGLPFSEFPARLTPLGQLLLSRMRDTVARTSHKHPQEIQDRAEGRKALAQTKRELPEIE